MVKVYNTDNEFLDYCDVMKEAYTEERLDKGFKILCFKVPCLEKYIELFQEEFYVETEDYNYVIKEVNFKANDFFEVYCYPDIEEIAGAAFQVFDFFEQTVRAAYAYCLKDTPWVVEYHSTEKTIATYQTSNVSGLEMVYQIAEDYVQELWFDTKNKVLHVYDKMGKNLGAYYSNELKLQKLVKSSSSYDYATVLIPIGKDGLTIESINNGRQFIENFTYSDKYIEKIWVNEDYDVAEKLKAAAEIYLDSIAQPQSSYKLSLSTLGSSVALGDTIILVDKLKRIKQKQRVVKITRYADRPEKSTLEISNLQDDFARDFVNQQKKVDKEFKYIKSVIANLK